MPILTTGAIRIIEPTTWVPTMTGWTSAPDITARYRVIGKTCFITLVANVVSTSNATTTTFTLPILPAAVIPVNYIAFQPYNNGAYTAAGQIRVYAATSIAECFLSGLAAWTASGNKGLFVNGFYEID